MSFGRFVHLFAMLTFFVPGVTASAAAQNLRDRYIVLLKGDASSASAVFKQLSKRHGVRAERLFRHSIGGFSARLSPIQRRALSRDLSVQRIVKDRKLSLRGNRHESGVQAFALATPTQPPQSVPSGVRRIGADHSATAKIDGIDERVDVDIAIIDTGIGRHPDLNRAGGISFVGNNTSNYNDLNGHGTHVSGTVGALDNAIGVVGVAPGARLWAVRVLDARGSGLLSDVIAGVDWVAQSAAAIEVANMSLGGLGSSDPSDPLRLAIQGAVAKGVVFVVAAGNDATDAVSYAPASFPEVISVSAIADSDGKSGAQGVATSQGSDDTFAQFSNFGSVVDIAAPGVDILSTWLLGRYKALSGTSMASPHVAGYVALRIAAEGRATDAAGVDAVRQDILNSASAQNSTSGFTGDPDSTPEPLADASAW